jgi:hypothetical protein
MAKKTQKPLLFVDTNIYLDFYRAGGEAGLTLLEHIQTVSDLLIITDQVEVEFLNNRQRVISEALKQLITPPMPLFVPAYLQKSRTAKAIERNKGQIRRGIETLKDRFAKLLENPSKNDPLFKTVKKAFSKMTPLNLKFAKDKRAPIFDAALRRFQRGFPPRKKQDYSIGDAINWEWVLDCAKSFSLDVLIVARDGDFGLYQKGYLNDFLASEFKSITKRKAELVPTLSKALKKLGIKVTPAEEKEEQSILAQKGANISWDTRPPCPEPPFWPKVLELLIKRAPLICNYLLHANEILYGNDKLVILFPNHAFLRCADTNKTRELIQEVFKELEFAKLKEIDFGASTFPEPWEPSFEKEPWAGFNPDEYK